MLPVGPAVNPVRRRLIFEPTPGELAEKRRKKIERLVEKTANIIARNLDQFILDGTVGAPPAAEGQTQETTSIVFAQNVYPSTPDKPDSK